mgnify:CR=1 FL=1
MSAEGICFGCASFSFEETGSATWICVSSSWLETGSATWIRASFSFGETCLILGPDDDIARFEYLKKSARNFGSVLIGIETSDAANFKAFCAKLDAAGFTYTDITNDETLAQFVI